MGNVANLRKAESPPAEPPLSPARRELAAQIARVKALDERRKALTAANEAAREAVWTARTALEASEAAVETAKTAAASHLVEVAIGTAGSPPVTIRQARAAVVDAEDELQSRQAARDALARQLEEAERWPASETARLREAALDVIRNEYEAPAMELLAQVELMQRDFVRLGLSLEWLSFQRIFPVDNTPGNMAMPLDPRVSAARSRLQSPVASWHELTRIPDLDGRQIWDNAVKQLMLDATAPLPAF